jgi:hypothetical protein
VELQSIEQSTEGQGELFTASEVDSARYVLSDPGDSQTPLWVLINDLDDGTLCSPPHQRDFVWDMGRRQAWIERLTHGTSRAVGCIVTYQIKNLRSSPTYINDGWQRLSTTREYLAAPEKYKSTRAEALSVVKSYKVTVQHRLYASQEEALTDFQGLNLGTSLTPYEFYYGTLATMPDYKILWEPLIDQLHDGIDQQIRLCGRLTGRRNHKYLRHDYVLLHYLLSGATGLNSYQGVASSDVKVGQNRATVEAKLRELLLATGPETARSELQRLLGVIRDDTALMEHNWIGIRSSPADLISNSVWRYLLHIGLWRRANSLPVANWQQFLTQFLTVGKGLSGLSSLDGTQRITIGMAHISTLPHVCRIVGSDLVVASDRAPRGSRPTNLRPGYDASHVNPYVTNGNGPTIPEPASLNRSRGAARMLLDEVQDWEDDAA